MSGRTKAFRLTAVVHLLVLTMPLLHVGIARGDQKPSKQVVTGSIKDALGRPVDNVEVVLRAQSGAETARTTTGDRGRFTLNGIPYGTYVLLARKQGFKPATKVIVLAQRTPGSLNLVLQSEQALTVAVQATQLRAQNGLSATGAKPVRLHSARHRRATRKASDTAQ